MGKLIVIEGLDGSGKGTQTGLLCETLLANGVAHRKISLPHYDAPSSALVKEYLAGAYGQNPGDVNAYAASAFYAVDRYAGFKTIWGADYEGYDRAVDTHVKKLRATLGKASYHIETVIKCGYIWKSKP